MSFTSRIAAAAARGYGMFAAVARAVDPFFNYVTALLHGDGTNGAQNNTFLDSSTNNFTITRNGNTTQGTFSPFSQTGWSNYFNGTSAYLTTPVFGAGNGAGLFTSGATFTVETWLYQSAFVTTSGYVNTIIGDLTPTTATALWWAIGTDSSNAPVLRWYDGAVKTCTGSVALPINTWNHVAFVCNAGTFTIYVNGVSQTLAGTTTITTPTGTTGNLYIGADRGNYVTGYASNLRVVKNSAVYTANFTPSTTPLTAITNTQLLTCQANRFLDASTNAYAITSTNASVQAFSPFNPTSAWSASSNGGSGYFDGSGDYLIVANNTALQMGSGDFTIEFWINYSSITGYQTPFDKGYTNAGGLLFQTGNGNGRFVIYANGAAVITETGTAPTNAWIHYALVRSGTTLTLYRDGVSSGTATNSTNFNNINQVGIGATGTAPPAGAVGDYPIRGYLADLRVVKGTAVYTANFTPPTAPLTAITNTQLLLSCTNAGIYDNAAVADYETVGNAQVSTAVVKYGTGSMSFNGTNSYLVSADKEAYNFGSGDFTAEAWVYPTSFANEPMIMGQWSGDLGGTGLSWALMFSAGSTGYIRLITSSTGGAVLFDLSSSPYALSLNTWYHIAAVRIGSTFKVYVNGNQVATTTNTSALYNATNVFTIGVESNSPTQYFSGYIDDIRLTKGYGRYPYNFTPPAAAFPNIGGTVTLTADPYFNYTTLLLPGNGTNGAQNNTFLDSSSNAFTITRNGNTTQGNFSPFSQTGWGNYFDGTGDYLTVGSSTAFGLGTGDFTIEGWLYPTANPTNGPGTVFDLRTGATATACASRLDSSLNLRFYDGPLNSEFNVGTVQLNTWTHVALVRSSGSLKTYINGTLTNTTAVSSDLGSNQPCMIGNNQTAGYAWNGYQSNFRIVKGTAVYTANFTPSTTPLTAISGTSLLTCQANRFLDASSNNFTITKAGDTSVQAFSPFAPTAAWTASTNGGSGYYDGSGDYLGSPSSAGFTFGTGDFTVEGWVYLLAAGDKGIFQQGTTLFPLSSSNSVALGINNTGTTWQIYAKNTNANSTATYTLNAWTHFALVRSGTTTTLYINGVSVITVTADSTNYTGTYMGVGSIYGTSTTTINAYIADFRVVKGTAVYTANFTPPTAPLTAITNTQLLLSATNGAIVDATAKNDLETVGNAQISTVQSKFGGSSMAFDGSGDWLSSPDGQNYNLGSGDFTIECWVYLNNLTNQYGIFSKRTDSGTQYRWVIAYVNASTGTLNVSVSTTGSTWAVNTNTTSALTASTWNHVAFVRYGSDFSVYVNGIKNTLSSSLSGSVYNGTEALIIGAGGTTGAYVSAMNGYIDDFRITKGIARYTSNFTPPTSAFLLQ